MGPNWNRGKGAAPPLPFPTPSLFPSFFSPTPERKRGILLGLPTLGAPPLGPASFSSLLYIRGQGTPQRHKFIIGILAVCGAPSTVTHLGHIVVVLRRSPAPVTSSSPSPRCRADETLPRPQLDQEYEGRHRAERVLNTEVSYVRF